MGHCVLYTDRTVRLYNVESMLKSLITAIAILVTLPCSAASGIEYLKERERGWFWYEPIEIPVEKKPETEKKPESQTSVAPNPYLDPSAAMKAYQKSIEDARNLAILDPTPVNVKNYMRVQKEAMNRSVLFADTWRRVLWGSPELDESIRSPMGKAGMDVHKRLVREDKESAMSALAQTDGIFFFFKNSCPYCHAQAPILKSFAARYGISVIPISLDGEGLPEYPNPSPDIGWADRLGVSATPAMFMVNPRTGEIVPLAYGVISEEEIKDRVYMIAMKRVGDI